MKILEIIFGRVAINKLRMSNPYLMVNGFIKTIVSGISHLSSTSPWMTIFVYVTIGVDVLFIVLPLLFLHIPHYSPLEIVVLTVLNFVSYRFLTYK